MASADEIKVVLEGVDKAMARFDEEDLHSVIDCVWWLTSACEALGIDKDENVAGAMYYVRSKGFHETLTAFEMIRKQVRRHGRTPPMRMPARNAWITYPARWKPVTGANGERPKRHNRHLPGKEVAGTISDAHGIVVAEAANQGYT